MYANNYIQNWQDVVLQVLTEFPNEACGVVDTDCIYHPYPNLHAEPLTNFELSSKAFLEHDIKAIIHSHTYDQANSNRTSRINAQSPSYIDQQSQIATAVEWGLVVCDGESVDAPIWWGDYKHRPDLFNRQYVSGAQDCFNFIADWLYLNKGIELALKPHDFSWQEQGEDYLSEFYRQWNFTDINTKDIEIGDVVLFKIRSPKVNHLGVYTGNGLVAHHLYNRLPIEEQLGKWLQQVDKVVRYEA